MSDDPLSRYAKRYPKSKAMIAKYQLVFCSPMGLEVLEDMGLDCGFGDKIDPDNQERLYLRNFFETLLSIVRGGNGLQQESYIPQVAQIPIHEHRQEQQDNG